jgi:hypothetical protein
MLTAAPSIVISIASSTVRADPRLQFTMASVVLVVWNHPSVTLEVRNRDTSYRIVLATKLV